MNNSNHSSFKSDRNYKSQEDEVTEGSNSIVDAGPLTLVVKKMFPK